MDELIFELPILPLFGHALLKGAVKFKRPPPQTGTHLIDGRGPSIPSIFLSYSKSFFEIYMK